ncbi:MAG: hypothetical protein LUE24_08340 [Lachnospiraceae bacterium]|nr:hypothetical protein [Lachnospiraceae bacterium]
METIIGVILLITYLAFIVYALKGGNLMLGLFIMAVLWSGLGAIAGVIDWTTINETIFNGGPTGFGSTAVYIIFGSWFGRVLIDTGIAGTIIRKAVELGGDKPGLTCILLCIVTALIFTTSYGPGAVVAIGVIVFPIMLSLGIPKTLAAGSFVMSVGCGLYFNQSLLTQAAGTLVVNDAQYLSTSAEWSQWYRFAFVAFAIHMVSIILMVLLSGKKKSHAWAATADVNTSGKNVGVLAMLTPLLPVTLAIVFGVQQVPAICISVIWALLFTGNMKSYNKIAELVQKTFHDGVADVGLVLAFLMFLQMFIKSAGSCANLIAPIVAPILPSNVFALFLIFGIFGFLALYRGPLTIWGAGVATFAIVASTTNLPLYILYPLFYIPCCTVTTNVCPTQSWNMWAIGYTQVNVKDYMKQVMPFALPCAFILELIAYFMFV